MCISVISLHCPPSFNPANHDAENCCRMFQPDAEWNSLLPVLIPSIKRDHI